MRIGDPRRQCERCRVWTDRLERQPYSHRSSPDYATTLPRRAVQQFETVGQIEIFGELNAGAAGRIVDENTIDGRRFRTEEDLGRARNPTSRTNPLIETLVFHR